MIEMICNTENDERCFLYVFRKCGHQMGKKKIKGKPAQNAFLCGFMTEKVGFEPTCPCGQPHFEGRESPKTSIFLLI